jgi:Holliday junction resolvase YEN1
MSISVQPIFIFDGPHKPPFKRNKKSGHNGASVPNMLTKQMLKLFGYPFYQAPGEAEAECALLQREGIVDAVLSEDVDTLMFGCGMTLRNWSSEGSRGNKSPTHVSVYEAKATKEGTSGLDREGMVLVALMSGGDYITEGIPGCGIKLACQAARAGFGESLCKISRNDAAALDAWRKNLAHEIQTNKSKYFRTRHKALTVPESFPNREVLGYYTHPVVSTASKIGKLKDEIIWDGEVDVPGLRLFVSEAFEWTNRIGAKKFIRGLAPVLLVHKLRTRGDRRNSGYGDIVLTQMNEMELVRAIGGNRNHFSTDGLRELRLIFMPIDIVGIDLTEEYDDSEDYGRDGLAPLNDDDQIEGYVSDDVEGRSASPSKRVPSQYDPERPDKVWVSTTIARIGVPLKVEDYEEALKDPVKTLKARNAAKRAAAKGGMPKGALDRFVKVSKPRVVEDDREVIYKPATKNSRNREESLPSVYLAPSLENFSPSQSFPNTTSGRAARPTRASTRSSTEGPAKSTRTLRPKTKAKSSKNEKPPANTNPWTMASLQASPKATARITKSIATKQKPSSPTQFKPPEWDLGSSPIPSSPPLAITKPETPKRHYSHSSPSSRSHPPSPGQVSDPCTKSLQPILPSNLHEELSLPNSVTISRRRSKKNPHPHLEPPNTPSHSRISKSEDRPLPRKEISSSPLVNLENDLRRESLQLPLYRSLGESSGNVVRKINFGKERNGSEVSGPGYDDGFGYGEDADIVENENENENEGLRRRTLRLSSKVKKVDALVIDLCSSPPVPRSQTSPILARARHSTTPPPSAQSPSLSSSQLPFPVTVSTKIPTNLASAEYEVENEDENVFSPNPTPDRRSRGKRRKCKEYIRIRESIGGGVWKDVDEDEILARDRDGNGSEQRKREGVWRRSEIEVLDLTEE